MTLLGPLNLQKGIDPMDSTTAAYPYARDLAEMPDAEGNPVRVGDWVEVDRPGGGREVALVTGITPIQEHEPGHLHKKTGLLDLNHSHFELVWIGGAEAGASSFASELVKNLNFRGDVMSSRSPLKVKKVGLTATERKALELRALNAQVEALRHAAVTIQGKLDDALARRARLEAS